MEEEKPLLQVEAPMQERGLQQEQSSSQHGYESNCWGCGLRVALPSYSPCFKCGYCGAITKDIDPMEKEKKVKRAQRCAWVMILRDRLMVCAVTSILLSIIVGGVWSTFPLLFEGDSYGSISFLLNSALTAILAFNTLFNYFAAAFRPAGEPPSRIWGNVEKVARGSLDEHTFCHKCSRPKPRRAHHCSACRGCVLDMDHHCPFIGNCVGAGNHRHFLLFLFWALLSSVYIIFLGISTSVAMWPKVMELRAQAIKEGNYDKHPTVISLAVEILQMVLESELRFSLQALGVFYLVMVAWGTLIGVGVLFCQQMYLITKGHTYIDYIQTTGSNSVAFGKFELSWFETWLENMGKIFGKGPSLVWFMPTLDPPLGTIAFKLHEKFP